MYFANDYIEFHLHERGEEQLLRELEWRREAAERATPAAPPASARPARRRLDLYTWMHRGTLRPA